MATPPHDATAILMDLSAGQAQAADRLLPLVYDELRALASAMMRSERRDHTLEPTALVHEAYMRLVDGSRIEWKGRAHFMAVAAGAIRHVLIDHARRTRAAKRGGGFARVTLSEAAQLGDSLDIDLLDLHDALERLAALNPRQSRIVELRFFGGLTNEEVAAVTSLARSTVAEEWAFARAWLSRQLAEGRADDA
ncbi:MAG: sigma-70 family RNA polymerase sigma factor [Phycisphaerales bacterium]|nr:sigma-70 family RNA polymerase sigma factor [Phycisphaerales bacterium]